jgi:drug/metabolite transporter (DMT)-like permease
MVFGAFAAVYFIWGSTYLAIRIAIETLPPFLMASTRFLTAGTLVFGFTYLRTRILPTWREWAWAGLVGGLMLGGGNGGVVWSEQWLPSGVAALIVASVPFWMVILDWFSRNGNTPSGKTLLGLVVGFIGVGILAGGDYAPDAFRLQWVPVAVLLGASFCWSLGSLISRSAGLPKSPVMSTGMQMLGGCVTLFFMALARGEFQGLEVQALSLRSVLGWGYLVLFGSIVAFSAYIWLLRVTSAANVSTYAFVNPAVAVLLGWLFAGEELTLRIGMATGLIVFAVLLVTIRRRKRRQFPRSRENRPEAGESPTQERRPQ